MSPARVQCEFCEKTFSKKANLTRHHNSNSCLARPNPDTIRQRCRYCNVQFKSRRVLKEHKRLKQCPGQRSLRPQQQPEQDAPPQQPPPQLPSHLVSMSQQQQINWLTEFLAKNDGQVTHNLMQSAWAMISATALCIPAVDNGSGSGTEESAMMAAAGQQQTETSKRSA